MPKFTCLKHYRRQMLVRSEDITSRVALWLVIRKGISIYEQKAGIAKLPFSKNSQHWLKAAKSHITRRLPATVLMHHEVGVVFVDMNEFNQLFIFARGVTLKAHHGRVFIFVLVF